MTRGLWLIWLPLLFLPNMGVGGATSFGTLEISDFLVVPYLVLAAPAAIHAPRRALVDLVLPTMLGFALWAAIPTLLIRERYGYLNDARLITGVLKLGKFVLYGVAGIMTARALGTPRWRALYQWSLLGCGLVVAITLFRLKGVTDELLPGQVMEGYKSKNAISVLMAILLVYNAGVWTSGRASRRWREAALPSLIVMAAGFLTSGGRGGWIAAIGGGFYLLIRYGLQTRTVAVMLVAAVLPFVGYGLWPEFREEVDKTLWPDAEVLAENQSGIAGVDDGARLGIWTHELQAVAREPLLGTGLFHRGGNSGIWVDGSHNFFIQMMLETGLPGGLLFLHMMALMWRQSGLPLARAEGLSAPLRASLITAIIGGMSGEYFYGGTVLLCLLLVYAPVGALNISDEVIAC